LLREKEGEPISKKRMDEEEQTGGKEKRYQKPQETLVSRGGAWRERGRKKEEDSWRKKGAYESGDSKREEKAGHAFKPCK